MADTAWVVTHACTRKLRLTRHAAMLLAQHKRSQGIEITAYRCCFSRNDSDKHWHIGHPPSMRVIADLARAIRDLHGNAPAPIKVPVPA